MSGADVGASTVTVWVMLKLNKTTLGMNKLVDVPLTSDVADVRTSVKSLFSNRLSRFDPTDIDLFPSTNALVKTDPPTFTGTALDPSDRLTTVLPSPLPPDFVLLAVVDVSPATYEGRTPPALASVPPVPPPSRERFIALISAA